MELKPDERALLQSLTGSGLKEEDLTEMAKAMHQVILKIQADRGVDREQAVRLVSDTLGSAGAADVSRLLRLPGDSGWEEG